MSEDSPGAGEILYVRRAVARMDREYNLEWLEKEKQKLKVLEDGVAIQKQKIRIIEDEVRE